ncbi:MAG: 2-iminoacetate synthase ThiH [Syntrophotaleaceae bacterium]
MSFLELFNRFDGDEIAARIAACGPREVERALQAEHLQVGDFLALLSPAAGAYLEPLAQKSHRLTQRRFGKTIQLYAPLYLSNECTNSCLYCGFNAANQVARRTLTLEQIEAEAKILAGRGFRHVLLLTGEAPRAVDDAYVAAAIRRVRALFSSIGLEVYPMDEAGYRQMVEAGADSLTVYQETYDRELYAHLHPSGRKRDFNWRLETPDRGGAAGLRTIGIGALLGLGDWRREGFYVGLHARHLARTWWRSRVSVSFPRIRPADGGFSPLQPVSDAALVQLICALRLWLPDAGLTLSTRESAQLRDHLLPLGITQLSAGSSTAPGGYGHAADGSEQFVIDDDRDAHQICAMLRTKGYEPVWKDWDGAFRSNPAEPAYGR